MKRILLFLTWFALLFMACNNKKSPEQKAADQLQDNIKTIAKDMEKNKGAILEGKENLEKLTPLTIEELKKLIPETLMGAKRTGYNASSAMGAGLASGDYKINDDTKITLNIYDCAGPAGAGIYSMQYLSMMNMEQESEDEYTKTVSYGDGKAFEHCEKATNDCTITWFAGGRYLVSLQGDKVGADALKKAGKELKF